jgi:hypothetical protein
MLMLDTKTSKLQMRSYGARQIIDVASYKHLAPPEQRTMQPSGAKTMQPSGAKKLLPLPEQSTLLELL